MKTSTLRILQCFSLLVHLNIIKTSNNIPNLYINEIYPNAGQMGFIEFYTKSGFEIDPTMKFGATLITVKRKKKPVILWLYDLSNLVPPPKDDTYILLGKLMFKKL